MGMNLMWKTNHKVRNSNYKIIWRQLHHFTSSQFCRCIPNDKPQIGKSLWHWVYQSVPFLCKNPSLYNRLQKSGPSEHDPSPRKKRKNAVPAVPFLFVALNHFHLFSQRLHLGGQPDGSKVDVKSVELTVDTNFQFYQANNLNSII